MKSGRYLCAIGEATSDRINDYKIGMYDKDNKTFSFFNGSYNRTELKYREKIGSNISCVLFAKHIDDIEF